MAGIVTVENSINWPELHCTLMRDEVVAVITHVCASVPAAAMVEMPYPLHDGSALLMAHGVRHGNDNVRWAARRCCLAVCQRILDRPA